MLALKIAIVGTAFGFGLQSTTTDLIQLVRHHGLLARSVLLAAPSPNNRRCCPCRQRPDTIALTIAALSFPDERFVGITILYLLIRTLVRLPHVAWQCRRTSATATHGRRRAVWNGVIDVRAGRSRPIL